MNIPPDAITYRDYFLWTANINGYFVPFWIAQGQPQIQNRTIDGYFSQANAMNEGMRRIDRAIVKQSQKVNLPRQAVPNLKGWKANKL